MKDLELEILDTEAQKVKIIHSMKEARLRYLQEARVAFAKRNLGNDDRLSLDLEMAEFAAAIAELEVSVAAAKLEAYRRCHKVVHVRVGRSTGPCTDSQCEAEFTEAQIETVRYVLGMVNRVSGHKEGWHMKIGDGAIFTVT